MDRHFKTLMQLTDFKASESVPRDLAKQTKYKHLGTDFIEDNEQ
ncbi:MAG: hypothetical protein ACFFBZ_14845 [Promethearchaeota archaeon]